MDIKNLYFILNDALNKALVSKDRIKQPNSNEIANFVSKYIEDNNQSFDFQQTDVKNLFKISQKELINKQKKRQKYYEDLAEKHKDNEHNYKKFTYKAMATRDCWKELLNEIY